VPGRPGSWGPPWNILVSLQVSLRGSYGSLKKLYLINYVSKVITNILGICVLEPSGRSWLCGSAPFFKLPQLPLRDTRRETRRFQGGPHDLGRSWTSWFLSWCLSEGVAGAWKRGKSHITSFFLRAPAVFHSSANTFSSSNNSLWETQIEKLEGSRAARVMGAALEPSN
jgi:hypothetical protein